MSEDAPALFQMTHGTAPLLISIPHGGTWVPPEVQVQLTDVSIALEDTDWHLDRLYAFATDLGASVLQASVSRYAVDLNRPPNDESLYPGQTTTGLCPTETFHGEPLYLDGVPPTANERSRRLDAYWRPYHTALRNELDRLRATHGNVLLWDAHSIASVLPRLFDGRLSDLNFGTADGRSCDARLIDAIAGAAREHSFTQVVNGRFKGGYITRHYGAPDLGIHAIQLELVQCLYMHEHAPFDYLPDRAIQLLPALRAMLTAALYRLTPSPAGT